MKTTSSRIYERALRVLPGGVSRNTVLRRPHPFYAREGHGCRLTDVEGVTRIDFANNMAALIHGHSHPAILEAVTRQLQRGTAFTFATEIEVEFAELLCSRSSAFEKIRFVNSGTEAVMACLKAARAFTGRSKIVKVEGAYHGLYDFAEVSQTANPSNWGAPEKPSSLPVARGTPASVLDEVIVIPFNEPEVALPILDAHADEIACVLIDLLPHRIGMMPATPGFVAALQGWTRRNGALLVFDEVITFRSEYGGAQEWFAERPDLTALGKIIGGGFPVGAIAGRADVLDVLNPLRKPVLFPHSGTFSANPVTMTAGLTAMKLFTRDEIAKLNDLGGFARRRIAETIHASAFPACVTGGGSLFRIHLKPDPPRNYREAFASPEESRMKDALLDHLFAEGHMLINTCSGALSTPMSPNEIDRFCDALLTGLRKLGKAPAALAAL